MAAIGDSRSTRKRKEPPWYYTDEWEATCPRCKRPIGPHNVKCPIDHSDLVVRETPRKKEAGGCSGFFLSAFKETYWVERQELCCPANDGFATTSIHCPYQDCRAAVQSDYIAGIWKVPRPIFHLPFVLLPTLIVVLGTSGVGLLFWPVLTPLLSAVYRILFWIWPLRLIFFTDRAYSFFDTNEAEKFSLF